MATAAQLRDFTQNEIQNVVSIIQPGRYIKKEINGKIKFIIDTSSPDPKYKYQDFVYVYGGTEEVRKYQVESQRAMLRYLLEMQKPQVAVKPNGKDSFELIRQAFLKTIKRSQAVPGATVGNFACDALSQPLTQTTLNAHKTIGAAATYSNVTERVTQILHVSHTQKQRVMTLHFSDKYLTFDDVIELRTLIEETKLFTVADIIMGSVSMEEAQDIIDNDDIALSFQLINNLFDVDFKDDTEVRVLSINSELMYQHNLDIFKLCTRIIELSNSLVYAIPTYEDEKYKVYLFLSASINIKKDQTVNDYFNKEIKHYMDDRIISGVRGIHAIYPRRERILGLVQNVYDGKYEIDGKFYNKCCILNLPEAIKLSVDASRFKYCFEFANIPFSLDTKYETNNKWNMNNYIFYVRSNARDIVNRVREFYTILNNVKDNDEFLRNTIGHLVEERFREMFKDFVNERFENRFENIKQELDRIIRCTEYYYCVSDGTNYRELPKHELFDFSCCTSNILYEVYDLMDVVGYRSAAIREMNIALGGSYINHQHIELTIDNICKLGAPYSVTADGLEKMSATVMQLSTKKEPMKYASRSAIRGEKMSMKGSLSAQMASQQAQTGSGQVDVVLDIDKMNKTIGKDKAMQMAKAFSIGRSYISVPSIKEKKEQIIGRVERKKTETRVEEVVEETTTKTNMFAKFRNQAPAATIKSQVKPEYSLKKKDNVEFLEKVVPSIHTNAMDVEFNKSVLQRKIEYPLNTKEEPNDDERIDFRNMRKGFWYENTEKERMKSMIKFVDSLPIVPATKYYELRLKKEIYGNVEITSVIKKRFNIRGASKLPNPESVNGIFDMGSGVIDGNSVYNYINDEVKKMKRDYSRFFD